MITHGTARNDPCDSAVAASRGLFKRVRSRGPVRHFLAWRQWFTPDDELAAEGAVANSIYFSFFFQEAHESFSQDSSVGPGMKDKRKKLSSSSNRESPVFGY